MAKEIAVATYEIPDLAHYLRLRRPAALKFLGEPLPMCYVVVPIALPLRKIMLIFPEAAAYAAEALRMAEFDVTTETTLALILECSAPGLSPEERKSKLLELAYKPGLWIDVTGDPDLPNEIVEHYNRVNGK